MQSSGCTEWGDTIVTVKRFYHGLPASSTPHRPVYGHPHPPLSSLSNGSFRDRENAFSYTIKVVIQAALAKVEDVVQGAVQIIARLTYRQRYAQSTGRDPFRCPHCGEELELWRIWHPTYGVIYDEGKVIKHGTYASTAQRAGP
jgi:hypothetical protein